MGSAVSAREMIDTARRITGTESLDQANAFCTDAELLAVLNGELAELHDTIVENHDDPYFKGTLSIVLDPNSSTYPLGIEVYKIVSVDMVWSPTIKRDAHRFTEAERNRFQNIRPSWSHLGRVWFRPQGDNIEFIPMPLTAVQVDINYIPTFTPLVTYTDTFNSQNQWHWMAIWGLAAYIRQKDDDETSAGLALSQKAAQKQRVISMAASRVEGEPPRVQRSRRNDDEDFF
jgi:hypothetical protein